MNEPRVAMITGYYNRGHLIERTLESMANQSYKNIDLVVFDDFSKDDTPNQIRLFNDRSRRKFRSIINTENRGFTASLIDAIKNTDAEFIAIQGSGDVSDPKRIEAQMDLMLSDDRLGVVGSSYVNIYEGTELSRIHRSDPSRLDRGSILKRNPFTHGEVIFRRSFYDAVGGYRPMFKFSQDYDLWLRMIETCRFGTRPETLYTRYIQRDGVTYDPEKTQVQARYSIVARRMSSMTDAERKKTEGDLSCGRILDVVPVDDPELQRRIEKSALRLLAWGDIDGAVKTSSFVFKRSKRYILRAVSVVMAIAEPLKIRQVVMRRLAGRSE